jgi:hypothetical protein
MDVLHKYLEFLWNSFQYDMEVFSQAWLYYWALLPATGYFIFFIIKWIVLTAPVWLPVVIVIRVANLPSPKCESCIYRTSQDFDDLNVDTVQSVQKTKKEEHTMPIYHI